MINIQKENIILPIFYSLVAFILLYLFDFPFAIPSCAFLVVYLCLREQSLRSFSLINLVIGIITGNLFSLAINRPESKTTYFTTTLSNYYEQTNIVKQSLTLMILVFLCVGIYAAIYKLKVRFKALPTLLVLLAFLLFFSFCLSQFSQVSIIHILLLGILIFFAKAFWMVAYQLEEVDLLKNTPIWVHFSTVTPPWQQTWTKYSVLRGYVDYLNKKATRTELYSTVRSGLKLIFYALVMKGFTFLLRHLLFVHSAQSVFGFSLVDFFGIPIEIKSLFTINSSNWTVILYQSVVRTTLMLMTLSYSTDLIVGIARLFGFKVEKNFDKPYVAQSFNEFLFRIYKYYISILQRLFFFPLWAKTRFIKHKKFRLFVVASLTILLGGIIDTTVRNIHLFTGNLFVDIGYAVNKRLAYFIALSIVVGLSSVSLTGEKKLKSESRKPMQALRFLFYCFLYGACFCLQT